MVSLKHIFYTWIINNSWTHCTPFQGSLSPAVCGIQSGACPGQTGECVVCCGLFVCVCLYVCLAEWAGTIQEEEGLKYQINIWTGKLFFKVSRNGKRKRLCVKATLINRCWLEVPDLLIHVTLHMGISPMNNPYETWVRETKAEEFRAKVCLEIGLRVRVCKVPVCQGSCAELDMSIPCPSVRAGSC